MKICTKCNRVEQNDQMSFCQQCGGALAVYNAAGAQKAKPAGSAQTQSAPAARKAPQAPDRTAAAAPAQKPSAPPARQAKPAPNRTAAPAQAQPVTRAPAQPAPPAFTPPAADSGIVNQNVPTYDAPVPQVPAFCMNCGTPFNEYGVCPQCGNTAQMQSMPVSRAAGPSRTAKPLECLKLLFSKTPDEGARLAVEETGHTLWPFFAGAFAILNGLALAGHFWSLLLAFAGAVSGEIPDSVSSFTSIPSEMSQFWSLALKFALAAAVLFVGSTALLMWPLSASEKKLSFPQLLNLNSYAFLPLTIASAATLLLCLVSYSVGAIVGTVLLIGGVLIAAALIYHELHKAASFKSTPFWLFTCVFSLDVAVFILSLYLIIRDLFTDVIGDFF